jgi:hypothetical protein
MVRRAVVEVVRWLRWRFSPRRVVTVHVTLQGQTRTEGIRRAARG